MRTSHYVESSSYVPALVEFPTPKPHMETPIEKPARLLSEPIGVCNPIRTGAYLDLSVMRSGGANGDNLKSDAFLRVGGWGILFLT